MTAQSINEKKVKLAEEEKTMNDQLQQYYEALGQLVSGCINNVLEDGEIDFSNLQKAPNNHQLVELLQNIEQTASSLETIAKEITELESLRTCPRCGTVVDDDELFCSKCGERLVKEMAYTDEDICPQCGKPKKGEGAFCVYCGFKFILPDQSSEPVERVCIKCGTKLPDDVIFCHVCGCKQPDKQ